MSGTSLDGIDIVLCAINDKEIKTLHAREYGYDVKIKQEVLTAIANPISLEFIGTLNHKLARMYSEALQNFLSEFSIDPKAITAIGLHGQTLWHAPNSSFPFSMQLGDGVLVAKRVQIDVVNDFRSGDVANGGQGAPITPAFHQALFDDKKSAVLNLGGIANITILTDDCIGYDVGAANILSDYWIDKNCNKPFDKEGSWAREGKVNDELLELLLSDPYFKQLPPKSTGREYFNGAWLEAKLEFSPNISSVDVQATLLEFTVAPIIQALKDQPLKRLIVCGGGAHNSYLMEKLSQKLAQKLDNIQVIKSDDLGVESTFLEAIAFAWLAYKRVNHQSIDLRKITGAKQPSILGAIHAKD
jgi:anhydro-N-acetylmuramic acid kinase